MGAAAGAPKTKIEADGGEHMAKHMRAAVGAQKSRHTKRNTHGGDKRTRRRACRVGWEAGEKAPRWKGVEEEKGAPYLHRLDGLVSVLHRADLIVHGLVWQQQLVEDLQRPGPVADRFQRHDRTTRRDSGRNNTDGPVAGGCAHTHTHSHTLSLAHTHFPPTTHIHTPSLSLSLSL